MCLGQRKREVDQSYAHFYDANYLNLLAEQTLNWVQPMYTETCRLVGQCTTENKF